jgi:UDP-N-acetyl-2-amino-2-deoxyglucuronate dehydrogenase
MTIHIGILGGGNISETHIRAARAIEGVEISAIYGQNQEKAARLGLRYGGTVYADLQRFIEHQPMAIVLIGSPSGLHAEQGILAAERGLHVLVEKPIDITTARADALVEACDKAGVKLGVFFQDRVKPHLGKVKEMIDTNRVGRPILVAARVRWHRPPEYYGQSRWRGTWSLDGGGALMNQGIHTVDLLLWLMGDVRRVYGKAVTALHRIEAEDTVVATLEFANGAIGTLEATTAAYPGYSRRVELTGTEGTILIEQDRVIAADLRTPTDAFIDTAEDGNASARSPVVADISGHRMILEDFLRAIANNSKPCCDGRDARRSVRVVQAIYQSSRTDLPVTIEN